MLKLMDGWISLKKKKNSRLLDKQDYVDIEFLKK